MPRRARLPPSDEKYIQEVIDGKSLTQAYRLSHPNASYDTCRTAGSQTLARDDIQSRIKSLMEKGRLPEKALARVGQLVDANKTIIDTNGGHHSIDDNAIRLGASQTLLKVAGVYSEQGVVNIHIGNTIQKPEDIDRLERIVADYKDMMARRGEVIDAVIVKPDEKSPTVGVGGVGDGGTNPTPAAP